ncbi:hypothetical protein B0T16DRAFT_407599 [Cercophora newfieldiana]|uniref:Uncharacterized protein n=1 Tax=Cercophora newfieldiana TaxID=92897 RepID=A0AA39YBJ5_9PEZI|nr:hypothetical protein B0T16DRAFT_407599 [Cercophora newfieldiana]
MALWTAFLSALPRQLNSYLLNPRPQKGHQPHIFPPANLFLSSTAQAQTSSTHLTTVLENSTSAHQIHHTGRSSPSPTP